MGGQLIISGAIDGAFQLLATWPHLLYVSLVFRFLLVLSFFKLCFWAAESISAYFSLKNSAMDSLQKMDHQTPFVKYTEGLCSSPCHLGRVWWRGLQPRGDLLTRSAGETQPRFQESRAHSEDSRMVLRSHRKALQGPPASTRRLSTVWLETGDEQITL